MPETQKTKETVVTTETTQEEHKSSLLTDILTVLGFAILFIIIIWGLVHLVGLIASSFSSNFQKTATTIEVSVPAQATSGKPLTVSWTYSPASSGNYAFVYQCQNGLNFALQGATSSKIAIPCGVAYTAGSNTSNSLTVIPTLTSTASATDTISIVFIPQAAGSQAQGNATLVVNPAAKPVPVKPAPAKTTSYTYPSGSSYSHSNPGTGYSGPADLAVSIISASINPNGYGTVTFNIANVGGSGSGSYTFSAQLPTAQPLPYNSPVQAPLAPGAHVVSTLNFTEGISGIFSVSINANDVNRGDNYASTQVAGPMYNNNYGYNGSPYVQYPQYTY